MKFCEPKEDSKSQQLFSEILLIQKEKGVTEEYKICGYHSDIKYSELNEYRERLDTITSLDLLDVVVPFAIADVTCDTSFHEAHLAKNVIAFGLKGKQEVLGFKKKFLDPQKLIGKPAFSLGDPFCVLVKERKVSFGYKCLIEQYVGEGNEDVYLDEDLKIKQIDAVRKSGKYSDWDVLEEKLKQLNCKN